MKTVREIFSKAFGEVPDGAYISHMAFYGNDCAHCKETHWQHEPCFAVNGISYFWVPPRITGINFVIPGYWDEKTGWRICRTQPGNISDRPAESFRGFFGKEYDDALDAEGETK